LIRAPEGPCPQTRSLRVPHPTTLRLLSCSRTALCINPKQPRLLGTFHRPFGRSALAEHPYLYQSGR